MPSPKVRAFIDFLVERLSFNADYMHTLCPDARACTAGGDAQASIARQLAQADAAARRELAELEAVD
jgi:hypothetical protein